MNLNGLFLPGRHRFNGMKTLYSWARWTHQYIKERNEIDHILESFHVSGIHSTLSYKRAIESQDARFY